MRSVSRVPSASATRAEAPRSCWPSRRARARSPASTASSRSCSPPRIPRRPSSTSRSPERARQRREVVHLPPGGLCQLRLQAAARHLRPRGAGRLRRVRLRGPARRHGPAPLPGRERGADLREQLPPPRLLPARRGPVSRRCWPAAPRADRFGPAVLGLLVDRLCEGRARGARRASGISALSRHPAVVADSVIRALDPPPA